jgi:hypothetical protein
LAMTNEAQTRSACVRLKVEPAWVINQPPTFKAKIMRPGNNPAR